MNKKTTIIAIVVIFLIALGLGGFFLMSKKTVTPETKKVITKQTTPKKPVPEMKSIKDLLVSGAPQQCSYTDATTTANISGTSYIAAGKIRGDFTTTTDKTTTTGHMIIDGKTSYLWMDGQTTGFKMSFDPTSVATPSAKESQGIDPNKAMNFTCSGWTVDSSVFVPPATIKFTDAAALMAPKAGTTTPVNQCVTCAALSGEAADQCKAALKCN